jgi:RNA 2',3'-cyclic 3'-phosphodiesterase
MRLFIAVNFDNKVKDAIFCFEESFKLYTLRGNFTLKENLHLTLVFLGETERPDDVRKAMDSVSGGNFNIKIGGIGTFNSEKGKVCWLGIEKSGELCALQSKISKALQKEGFKIENHSYNPHLTLSRDTVFKNDCNLKSLERLIPALNADVEKISLMKSERIDRKLVYIEIYSVILNRI